MRITTHNPKAFTLVELLVVIAIIGLLVSVLLPVLGSARDIARHCKTLSNVRQLNIAHRLYQDDYAGHVPWGYTPTSIGGQPVTVTASTGQTFGIPVAERYPWRLERYISSVWAVLHSHQPTPAVPADGEPIASAFLKAYTLSLYPSIGLNGVFVGGYQGPFAGFKIDTTLGDNVANRGQHVVFYDHEVRRPSELIVFAEAQARIGDMPAFPGEVASGFHTAIPPRAHGQRWSVVNNRIQSALPSSIQGLPIGRYGSTTVTGFFDGHAAGVAPAALEDMRLWANHAITPDYDF